MELQKIMDDTSCPIAFIQEPPKNKVGDITLFNEYKVIADNQARAAIVINDTRAKVCSWGKHNTPDLAAAYWDIQGGIVLISVYFDQNEKIDITINRLNKIINEIETQGYNYTISGDFNAHSDTWGKYTDQRGKAVEEFIIDNNLILHNENGTITWRNKRNSSSIDITLSSMEISHLIDGWTANFETSSLLSLST